MTVLELIAKLQTLNPTVRVVVQGYEGGLVEVSQVTKGEMVLDLNTESYYGPHEEAYPHWPEYGTRTVPFYCLTRNSQ